LENNELEIGVVLEAFLDHSLEDALKFLSTSAPEVSYVEVGAGGYGAPPPWDVGCTFGIVMSMIYWPISSQELTG